MQTCSLLNYTEIIFNITIYSVSFLWKTKNDDETINKLRFINKNEEKYQILFTYKNLDIDNNISPMH